MKTGDGIEKHLGAPLDFYCRYGSVCLVNDALSKESHTWHTEALVGTWPLGPCSLSQI